MDQAVGWLYGLSRCVRTTWGVALTSSAGCFHYCPTIHTLSLWDHPHAQRKPGLTDVLSSYIVFGCAVCVSILAQGSSRLLHLARLSSCVPCLLGLHLLLYLGYSWGTRSLCLLCDWPPHGSLGGSVPWLERQNWPSIGSAAGRYLRFSASAAPSPVAHFKCRLPRRCCSRWRRIVPLQTIGCKTLWTSFTAR